VISAKRIAGDLINAELTRTAIDPFTHSHPNLDVETAFTAQWLFVEHLLSRGESLVGAKLGPNCRDDQESMGVCQPSYGWITSGMMVPHGQSLPLDELIRPRAEPGIAFLINDKLETPATAVSVLAATDAVFAAIDVSDSRYTGSGFGLRAPDIVADNASAGRVVLGSQVRKPSELEDLRLVGCVLRHRGDVVATAAGAAAMGHPATAVAWLVNDLAKRGKYLVKGSIVLSGGLLDSVELKSGDSVSAEFDGLGSVEIFG
jgi:2-oxo-3-hexenedioate decarboxylase